ncbi:DNA-3-methyladenine glycosylase 2 family protein [Patescibacteria group bacterium]|nr:DNA-3-methyladenine glycosylase 2 family protein [Patescibacteria group bacterium]
MQDGYIKNHFKKVDPTIYTILKDLDLEKWVKRRPKSKFFSSLCSEIISQQLSDKAAGTIHKRFLSLLPDKKVTPDNILNVTDKKLRSAGMSWAKASYLKNIAAKTKNGELNLNALPEMSDGQVTRELTEVKGIGSWTAEMFLIFCLGREDVFSHGDQGLRTAIKKLYKLKSPSPPRIEKIVNKWSPFKSYGCIALWHSIDT